LEANTLKGVGIALLCEGDRFYLLHKNN